MGDSVRIVVRLSTTIELPFGVPCRLCDTGEEIKAFLSVHFYVHLSIGKVNGKYT